jgi:hypothetical protein
VRTEEEVRERLLGHIEKAHQARAEWWQAVKAGNHKLSDKLKDTQRDLATMMGTLKWVLNTTEEEDKEMNRGLYD